MIAIPNMDKPKSCYECDFTSISCYEWFCDRLDRQFPIELQRGEIDVLPDCPLIEIDDNIWKCIEPKISILKISKEGWLIAERSNAD